MVGGVGGNAVGMAAVVVEYVHRGAVALEAMWPAVLGSRVGSTGELVRLIPLPDHRSSADLQRLWLWVPGEFQEKCNTEKRNLRAGQWCLVWGFTHLSLGLFGPLYLFYYFDMFSVLPTCAPLERK